MQLIVRRDDTEVEMVFPRNRFSLTPIQIGELSTLPGVIDVVQV